MKTRRVRTSYTVYICEKCGKEDTAKDWLKHHEAFCLGIKQEGSHAG